MEIPAAEGGQKIEKFFTSAPVFSGGLKTMDRKKRYWTGGGIGFGSQRGWWWWYSQVITGG